MRLLAWFKPEAAKFINACPLLIPIFDRHNITIYIRTATKLDNIKYEDAYQVLQLDRKPFP